MQSLIGTGLSSLSLEREKFQGEATCDLLTDLRESRGQLCTPQHSQLASTNSVRASLNHPAVQIEERTLRTGPSTMNSFQAEVGGTRAWPGGRERDRGNKT